MVTVQQKRIVFKNKLKKVTYSLSQFQFQFSVSLTSHNVQFITRFHVGRGRDCACPSREGESVCVCPGEERLCESVLPHRGQFSVKFVRFGGGVSSPSRKARESSSWRSIDGISGIPVEVPGHGPDHRTGYKNLTYKRSQNNNHYSIHKFVVQHFIQVIIQKQTNSCFK